MRQAATAAVGGSARRGTADVWRHVLGILVNAHESNQLTTEDIAALRRLPTLHVGVPGTASAGSGA